MTRSLILILIFINLPYTEAGCSNTGCNSKPPRCCKCYHNDECMSCGGSCSECTGYNFYSNCGGGTCYRCTRTCTHCYDCDGGCGCYDYCCEENCTCERGDNYCESCVNGSSRTSNFSCNCNSGWNADPDDNECCMAPCSECWGSGWFHECTVCASGYNIYDKMCIPACPTGWSVDGSDCVSYEIHPTITVQLNYNIVSVVNEFSWGGIQDFEFSFSPSGPWPVDKRGYYFLGTGGGKTADSIVISPHHTINMWVRVKSNSGEFFSKTNVKMGVSGGAAYYSVYAENKSYTLNSPETVSASNINIKDTWRYVSGEFWVDSDGKSVMRFRIDNSNLVQVTSGGRTALSDEAEKIEIGKSFEGFIYFMRLYNHVNSYHDDDILSNLSLPSSFSGIFPSNCEHNQVVNSNGSCSDCPNSCSFCVEDSFPCNQCFDLLVADCYVRDGSSKSHNWCTVVDRVYYDRSTNAETDCDSLCKRCLHSDYNDCCECDPGFFLIRGLCQEHCPTGFNADTTLPPECDYQYTHTFYAQPNDLLFKTFDTTTSTQGSIISGTDSLWYPDYGSYDPVAARYRGRYLPGDSVMMMSPNSQSAGPKIVLSTAFTLGMWIKPVSSTGVILDKYPESLSVTPAHAIKIELVSGKIKLSLGLDDNSLAEFQSSTSVSTGVWSYVAVRGDINSTPRFYMNIQINTGNENSGNKGATWFEDLDDDFWFILGASRQNNGDYGEFYTGFIWSLTIYNDYVTSGLVDSSCNGGCSFCPYGNSNACLSECSITQYVDSYGNCQNCHASCTRGCATNDNTCNLCQDTKCKECDDFTSQCRVCKDHATIDFTNPSATCACIDEYYWNTSLEICEACSSYCIHCTNTRATDCTECKPGRKLVERVCLSSCPTGYSDQSQSCSAGDTYIFHLEPKRIEGVVLDERQSYKVLTGDSASFFSTYDALDPYAAKDRGYYFAGSSLMQLPPNAEDSRLSIIFHASLTISLWIRPEGASGYLLSKQDSDFSSTLILSLNSRKPELTLLLESEGVQQAFTHTFNHQLTLSTWSVVTAQVSIDSDNVTRLSCYVNGVSYDPEEYANYYFTDVSNDFKILIGASYADASSFRDFYTGFLYSLKIWNSVQSASIDYSSSCSGGCSICPTSNACISTCDLNQYPIGNSCGDCHASCDKGCVDADAGCSLCENDRCLNCSDYTGCDGLCIENASGGACDCDSDAVFIDGECQECHTGCASCTNIGFQYCTSCISSYVYYYGICRDSCASGFYKSGSSCIQQNGALVLDFQPNQIAGQWSDSVGNTYTTGTSSTFYYDYETNDPIAAPGRGYYFHGGAMVKVGSTNNFAPDVTFEFWVRPKSSNGVLLVKQLPSSFEELIKIEVNNNRPRLTLKLNSAVTQSCSNDLSLNQWNALGMRIDLSSGTTTLKCFVNTATETENSLDTIYFQDTSLTYLETIGALITPTIPTDYFTGFIYSMQAYNAYRTVTFNTICYYGSCSVCPSNTCLPLCEIEQYQHSGTSESACSSCSSSCPTGYSCLNSGASCNLCSDSECLSCSSYSGNCLQCKEHATNTGNCECTGAYYYDSSTEQCEPCHNSCGTCSDKQFHDCLTCAVGYLLVNTVCYRSCPTGYVSNGSSCVESYSPAFQLNPSSISGLITDVSSTPNSEVLAGSSTDYYPTYDSNDPKPAKDRGLYFDGASAFLQLPPNANTNVPLLVLSNELTLTFWVYHMADGTLMSKQKDDNQDVHFEVQMKAQPRMTLRLQEIGESDSPGLAYSECSGLSFTSSWALLVLKLRIDNSGRQYLQCVKNGSSDSDRLIDTGYFLDLTSEFTFLVGASKTSTGYGSFWKGMLYELRVYQKETTTSSYSSYLYRTSCSGSCSHCPYSTAVCIPECAPNYYWNGSSCTLCDSNCEVCARSDTSCNLCYDQECLVCSDFTSGTCSACIDNASLSGGSCSCSSDYAWDSTREICVHCDTKCSECQGDGRFDCKSCKSPYFWHQNVCFEFCPTGYTQNQSTNECDFSFGHVLDLNFDTPYGQITSSDSGAKIRTGSQTEFYPKADSDDPWPVNGRGYYFHGNSVAYLPPYDGRLEFPAVLSPQTTFAAWLKPHAATGTVFCKQMNELNTRDYFCVKFDNLYVQLSLELSTSALTYTTDSSTSSNQWVHVAIGVNSLLHTGSQVQFRINAGAVQRTTTSDYFIDIQQGYFMTIGARKTTQVNLGEYYTGYIYMIKIWNTFFYSPFNALDVETSGCIYGCSVCPSDRYCLPNCDLNQYYDSSSGTCGGCSKFCPDVCINSTTCSLCQDLQCHSCVSYTTTACEECKEGAADVGGDCQCTGQNLWHYREELCHECVNRCLECGSNSHIACTKCEETFFMAEGHCLDEFCPTGYTQDASARTCTGGGQVFKLDLAEVILGEITDPQNSIVVQSGSSTNFYPNYDTQDPKPAKERGYYFDGNDYMSIDDSTGNELILAPKFAMSMWVNHRGTGPLFSKQSDSGSVKYVDIRIISGNRVQFTTVLVDTSTFLATTTERNEQSVSTLGTGNWYHLGFVLSVEADENTAIAFYVNGALDSQSNIAASFFEDIPTGFTVRIGRDAAGYSFTGFIRHIYIWGGVSTDFISEVSTSCSGCDSCLPSTLQCIPTCDYDEFSNPDGTCSSCPSCNGNTCVNDENVQCNLCYNEKCDVCTNFESDGCLTCKTSAVMVDGQCECASNALWNQFTFECDLCYAYCETCQQEITTRCDVCTSNPRAYKIQGICTPVCPTGYIISGSNCYASNKVIFEGKFVSLNGDITYSNINLRAGESINFYPVFDSQDPFPAKDRGYYFDGSTSVMKFDTHSNNNYQVVLPPEFSMSFWVKPQVFERTIISRQKNNQDILLQVETSAAGNPLITIKLEDSDSVYTATCDNQLSLNTWHFLGIRITIQNYYSRLICRIDSSDSSSVDITTSHYLDYESSYTFTLGSRYTTSSLLGYHYQGFMWQIKIWNYDFTYTLETSSACSGFLGCSICPSSRLTCLSPCEFDHFFNGAECEPCHSSCSHSCVRANDCSLCESDICATCVVYDQCYACTENATLSVGTCTCDRNKYTDSIEQSINCCYVGCESCEGDYNGDCSDCAELYYMNPENGICLQDCPIGYYKLNRSCQPEKANSLVMHFKFDRFENTVTDQTGTFQAYMGADSSFINAADDPYPIYQSGVYFHGSNFAKLPPNTADLSRIILGNTFTLALWVRPVDDSREYVVLSKEKATEIKLTLYITSSTVPKMKMKVNREGNASFDFSVAAGAPIAWDSWTYIGFTLKRLSGVLYAEIFVNGVSAGTNSLEKAFFEDDSSTFTLGTSFYDNKPFKGFVYEVLIYNYVYTFAAPSTSCGCAACSMDGDCLVSCSYLQYYDSACNNCHSDCSTGCVRGNDCKMNLDEKCLEASSFLPRDCTLCVPLATKDYGTDANCECVANAVYASDACSCETWYIASSNSCAPHYYHIQSGDVSGIFSEDYTAIEFTFTKPMLDTTSSNCADLFDAAGLAMLGTSPSCQWPSWTFLKVTMGTQATYKGESITFKSGALYTNIIQDASNAAEVSLVVNFEHPTTAYMPTAVLVSDDIAYVKCQDFTLEGSSSYGGHHRSLECMWDFSVSISGFSFYSSDNCDIVLSRTVAEAFNGFTVTLNVRNWLGNTDSKSKEIIVDRDNGFSLRFDTSIQWTMKASESKSIQLSISSYCPVSSNLSYEWSLVNTDKTLSDSFFSNQKVRSRLFIAKNSLYVGEWTFRATVTDSDTNSVGITQFTLNVEASELKLNLKFEETTWNIDADNELDASDSSDPDDPNASLTYLWECFHNGIDCYSLISSNAIAKPSVLAGSLEENQVYTFTVTVSKDTRSKSMTLTVNTVKSDIPVVTLDGIPEFVNVQKILRLNPNVSGSDSYTYNWSIVQGGTFQTQSTSNRALVIDQNSMQENTDYKFKLTVTGASGAVSEYLFGFTTGSKPTSGGLTISPTSGTDFSTDFTFTASGWVHSDSLKYQFGYILDNVEHFVNHRNESSTFTSKLPSGNSMTLFVKVYDTKVQFGYASTTITVNKDPTDNSGTALTYLKNKVQSSDASPDELPHLINLVNSYYISEENVAVSAQSEAFSAVMDAANFVKNHLDEIESPEIELLLGMVEQSISRDIYSASNSAKVLSYLQNVLDSTEENSIEVDQTQVNYYISTIDKGYAIDSASIESDNSRLMSAHSFISTVLRSSSGDLTENEEVNFASTNINGQSRVYAGESLHTYQSPPGLSCAFTVPNDSALSFPGSSIVASVVEYGAQDPSLGRAAVDFSLFNLADSTNALAVSLGEGKFEVEIPVGAETSTECVYWKGSAWSTDGMSFKSIQNLRVKCESNHLSLFSAGSNIPVEVIPSTSDEDSFTISVVVIYLYGLLVCWSGFAYLFYKLDLKQHRTPLVILPEKNIKGDLTIEDLNESSLKLKDDHTVDGMSDIGVTPNITSNTVRKSNVPDRKGKKQPEERKEEVLIQKESIRPVRKSALRSEPKRKAGKIDTGIEQIIRQKFAKDKKEREEAKKETVQKVEEDIFEPSKILEESSPDLMLRKRNTEMGSITEMIKNEPAAVDSLIALHVHIGGLCFKSSEYDRLIRLCKLVSLLIVQATLIGAGLSIADESYTYSSVFNIPDTIAWIVSSIAILISNFFITGIASWLMKNPDMSLFSGKAIEIANKRSKFKKKLGGIVLIGISMLCVIIDSLISFNASDGFNYAWADAIIVAILLDAIFFQNLLIVIEVVRRRKNIKQQATPIIS